jgi:hypothetical protein
MYREYSQVRIVLAESNLRILTAANKLFEKYQHGSGTKPDYVLQNQSFYKVEPHLDVFML